MLIDHSSPTILFIDHHDDDRQYWVQRLNVLTRLCDPGSVHWKVRDNHLPVAAGRMRHLRIDAP